MNVKICAVQNKDVDFSSGAERRDEHVCVCVKDLVACKTGEIRGRRLVIANVLTGSLDEMAGTAR